VRLGEALLSRAGAARARLAALPDLEASLTAMLAEARRAWPAIALGDEAFVAHLGERLAADVQADLAQVQGSDLYFAAACAAGDPAAVAELEARYMPRAASYFARNGSLAPHAEELMQLVRVRLLVSDAGARPRIAEYSGRAPFGAWFRVLVSRLAIDYADARKIESRERQAPASPDPDPELELLRTHHRADLEAAFAATLAELPPATATLLRLYYFEGVSAEAIGKLQAASARTVQRRIADARAEILRQVHERLGARLQLPASQVGSLVRAMHSQVDVSIHRFFDGTRVRG
jgi:RNA polymerase sigma-70 factor (ECF subfamily)